MRSINRIGLLTLALFGCTVESTTPPPPGPGPNVVSANGTLVVDWTLNGTKDPNLCFESAVASVAIDVFFVNGPPAGTFEQSCTAFATSITLATGSYTANATLIDTNGTPRTTSAAITPFTIFGNDIVTIPIDFPATSFF